MLSVAEALEAILRHAHPLPPVRRSLRESLGSILAEDVVADIDMPPFDKALMDGYAVRSADLAGPAERRLRVVEEILAGRTPTRAIGEGEAARIMTGAPIPEGADAVVMVERTRMLDEEIVLISGPVAPASNRLDRGREMRKGELLLPRGTRIDPVKLGLIASAGLDPIWFVPTPVVRVVPTGDELIPRSRLPAFGEIRDSNSAMLAAMARAWGARSADAVEVAPDEPEALRSVLQLALDGRRLFEAGDPPGLEHGMTDVLLVSGGVSAGVKDLVPAALRDLGIKPVFHKVNVKPGKPLWFGVGPPRGEKPGALVFGLPGNPVSGLVGFLLFVRPALDALAGRPRNRTPLASFPLHRPFEHRGDRPTYHPARLESGRLITLDWAGSADLRAVASADGFAAFPAGDRSFAEGDEVDFLPLG